MSLRQYLRKLEDRQALIRVSEPISSRYEIAAVMKQLEPKPVFFENVHDSSWGVVGNLFCTKKSFAEYFGIEVNKIIPLMVNAINKRRPFEIIDQAPCQEVIRTEVDLDTLPILRHFPGDGGNYITSGIVIARHPVYGQNVDFHRCMQISKTEMAVRVVKSRHFDMFLEESGQLEVAVCIGNLPNVLAAAATSVEIGVNELEIASALEPLLVVKAKTVDLLIPAETEFVLEGTVYRDRRRAEGPFVDLTETPDIVRQEPVFEVKAITHRKNALWQALLPGGLEHKLLMGMPREPTIFNAVNKVVHCLDVNVNPGGCSWLHAIVQIDKQKPEDGHRAIEAAFSGHRSCKHVFVVDKDINIYDPAAIEWAMATRFQGDRDMIILDREKGSSLDPSADPATHLTTKIGFDLTAPTGEERQNFQKVPYPPIDITRFLQNIDNAKTN